MQSMVYLMSLTMSITLEHYFDFTIIQQYQRDSTELHYIMHMNIPSWLCTDWF